MKLLPVLLGLSVAANAALLLHLQRATSPSSAEPAEQSTSANDGSADVNEVADALALMEPAKWTGLPAEELLGRLRLNGFPPHIQRAVISAHVDQAFLPRRLELLQLYPADPYWQQNLAVGYDPALVAAQRSLGQEQRALLRQLLGEDPMVRDEFSTELIRSRFGDLPREKIDATQQILADYSDLRSQISLQASGIMLAEDRERQALLDREEREDLAAILTPEELRAYELRSSRIASTLRRELILFEPTEEEYAAIYDARRVAEEQLAGSDPAKVRTAVVTALQDQLDRDRLTMLEQALDPAYGSVNRIVARLGLPAANAQRVVELQRDVTTRLNELNRDSTLSATERSVRLTALNQQTTQQLTSLLGNDGMSVYRDMGGHWLRRLEPPSSTPPASR